MTGSKANVLLLRDSDLAERLNVSRRQIWKLRANGLIPEPVHLGTSTRWRATDIDAWLLAGCPRDWSPTAEVAT